jgi:biotin carboxyl carrier protein
VSEGRRATPAVTEGTRTTRFTALVGEELRAVEIQPLAAGRFRVVVDGRERVVDSRQTGDGSFSLLIEHATAEVSVTWRGDEYAVAAGGRTHRIRLLDERARRRRERHGSADGGNEVRAQMPGKVVAVLVAAGATVERGQGLLVIEAMKMENEIAAPRAGTIAELKVQPGQPVESGELLIRIE